MTRAVSDLRRIESLAERRDRLADTIETLTRERDEAEHARLRARERVGTLTEAASSAQAAVDAASAELDTLASDQSDLAHRTGELEQDRAGARSRLDALSELIA